MPLGFSFLAIVILGLLILNNIAMADPITSLTVRIKTGSELFSGTDDDVYLRLYIRQQLIERKLENPGHDDFERGQTDTFIIDGILIPDPCEISKIGLRKSPGSWLENWLGGWQLEAFRIAANGNSQVLYFEDQINTWLEDNNLTWWANAYIPTPCSTSTIGELTCNHGQIAIFDGGTSKWVCGDLGNTLGQLACSDSQIPVYNQAANQWQCRNQAAGGPAYVLKDANGNEIGPVISLYNAPVGGRDALDKALVAITLPDSGGTPRTALVPVTKTSFGRSFHNTEASPSTFPLGPGDVLDPLISKLVLFDGDNCTGNIYFLEYYAKNTGFSALYSPSLIVEGPGVSERRLYIGTGALADGPDITIKSAYPLWGSCS